MAEISLIVPVFRAEPFLERCVDSILAQTIADWNLVLVDDGSPDRCPAICDACSAADPRIHVIHQTNRGPSAARNRGIELALENGSEYIAFIDCDDCVHPQYLERLREALRRHDAGIAMCRHKYISASEVPGSAALLEQPADSALIDPEKLMTQESNSFNYCWGKLFSAQCFRSLRFPEDVSFGEDNLTIYKAFFSGVRIAFFEDQLYYYYYTPTGITKSPWKPDSLQCFLGIREQLAFYEKNGYRRAYRKELELYIQQCAYQIHRIREDRSNRRENRPHLITLKRQMKALLAANPSFRTRYNRYWHEALHPVSARIRRTEERAARNLRERGLRETLEKLIGRGRQA